MNYLHMGWKAVDSGIELPEYEVSFLPFNHCVNLWKNTYFCASYVVILSLYMIKIKP